MVTAQVNLRPKLPNSNEIYRFRGCNHSSRDRADMGGSDVPAGQKECSEVVCAVTKSDRNVIIPPQFPTYAEV